MGLASKVLWSRLVTVRRAVGGQGEWGAGGVVLMRMGCGAQVISHGGLGLVLWRRAQAVDMRSNKSIYETYMFVWQVRGRGRRRIQSQFQRCVELCE